MVDQTGERRRILAMGGGGFTMGERSPALDRFVLNLTGKPVPRICFMPTASGDASELATRFYERFEVWPCEPTILSLFHLARDRVDPREHLLSQDAIYVGGGSMRNMLAVWREHGVDAAMRSAWERGIVLAGLSAGAMCWFQGGISASGGAPAVVHGLGLLDASLSVHLDGEPARWPVYRAAVAAGELAPGYAVDNGAAVLFQGAELNACVASRAGARVIRVSGDGAGGVTETAMGVALLPGADTAAGAAAGAGRGAVDETEAVSELRELRAGRHRWD